MPVKFLQRMFKKAFVNRDITARPWAGKYPPKRILLIRLQAMGDTVITLPYIQHLKKTLPTGVILDFLTREEVDAIPRCLELFNRVFSIKGGRNFKKQFLYTCSLLPLLLLRRYDVVIDLQDNLLSWLVIKTTRPKAWSVFDRISPIPAGERTRVTIEAAGMGANTADYNFILKTMGGINSLLRQNGWDGVCGFVILNPAGAFSTRNWPLENYVLLAKLWLADHPKTQFLMLGIGAIADKAAYFEKELGNRFINLVNKTNLAQAFAIVQKAAFVLSEDSGLMHMAWVSGRPTLALFGSSRSDWTRPLGRHSAFLGSQDLPCGNCMLEVCKYGDTHCLTRYTAELVYGKAINLIQSLALAE